MLYVKLIDGRAVSTTTEYQPVGRGTKMTFENRNDWRTMERAKEVAKQLTTSTGVLHIATDAGPCVSPRYDVIEAPQVGQQVSKYFNGDSYPAGVIAKISDSLKRIQTSTGAVFYRRGASGAWIEGRTWSMTQGWHAERNPSF